MWGWLRTEAELHIVQDNKGDYLYDFRVNNEFLLLSFSRSVVSDSLQPHGLQHTRLPCPSPSPRACSNSHPLSQWCPLTISSSVVPVSSCPQSFPASQGLSSELAIHIRWPKYWSFSFSISPSNEYSGLISFRIDWFDLLAVQGTLKSLLQHHSLKASILWCSAFFMIQLSHHLFLRVLTQVTMENLNKFNGIKNQNLGLVKGHCKQRPHLQEDIHWWKVRPWTTERMRTDQQEQRTTAEKSKTVRDVS